MNILKKVVSLALCAVVPFVFASCSADNGEEVTTSTTNAVVESVSNESKEDLLNRVIEANLLENLLKKNECVSYVSVDSENETTVEAFFKFNSEIVRVCDQNLKYAEEHLIAFEYKDMNILSVNGGRFYVRAFVDEFGTENEEEITPWYNDYIAYSLIYDNLSLREETDEYYIFENLGDDPNDELYIQTVCYVDKQTLNVTKEVHNNDGYIVEEEYIYNEPLEIMNELDAWNGEMKTVTVVFETYRDGDFVRYTEEYEIPYNWEIRPENNQYDSPPFMIYLDEDFTQEYEYPGDGIDYTIYVTTSLG